MLSLERAKQQVRLDPDFHDEDELLNSYIIAAGRLVENHTWRTLITDSDESPDPETTLIYSGDIEVAMLLLVGNWYANRESVVTGESVAVLPMAVDALLQPYVRYLE